jgi:hypothetical protein
MPFEKRIIDQAVDFEFFPDKKLKICSADDLIVMKGFAGRDKDFSDIRGIVIKQKGNLNEDYVLEFLTQLADLKEEPELIDKVKDIFNKYRDV